MASPLDGEIARQVGAAFNALFLPATLTRDAVPSSPAYEPFDPPAPVSVEYSCRAIVEAYSDKFRLEGLVQANERKVLILATSLSVRPQPQDRVTIRGITFTVVDVKTDPAEAVWECKGAMG